MKQHLDAADMAAMIESDGQGISFPASLYGAFDLGIPKGQTTILLGRSGSGKSTLLQLLLSEVPLCDSLTLGWTGPKPLQIGWMAQVAHLLPWKSALENLVLGDRLAGRQPDFVQAKQLFLDLGLRSGDLQKPVSNFSGGMRQRLALARCLYQAPNLYLLDEPLSALDTALRLELQALIADKLSGKTVVLVTHDPFEAARLGNNIYVLAENQQGSGRVVPKLIASDERAGVRSRTCPIVLSNQERLTRAIVGDEA